MLKEDTVVPIVFIDKFGKALSPPCCVRIENGKWRKGLFECDLKLLEFGENETLSSVVEYQNDFITDFQKTSQERYETLLAYTEAQTAKLTEMNQYTAYIFAIVLVVLLYRILISALNSMFGGG